MNTYNKWYIRYEGEVYAIGPIEYHNQVDTETVLAEYSQYGNCEVWPTI